MSSSSLSERSTVYYVYRVPSVVKFSTWHVNDLIDTELLNQSITNNVTLVVVIFKGRTLYQNAYQDLAVDLGSHSHPSKR